MTVTVGQLIEFLAELDPEIKIAVSADAEGNEFSGLDAVGVEAIDASWDGERTNDVIDPDDIEDDDEQDLQDIVILWRV